MVGEFSHICLTTDFCHFVYCICVQIWTVLGFSRHVVRTLPATAEVVSGYTTRLLEEDRALEFVNDSGGWVSVHAFMKLNHLVP